ncbi:MAG: MFS transporter, partial [Planctomycetota bacterium]
MSVAKEPVADAMGLIDTQMGWVFSIFALGYALFQTPAGLLADKYGARILLTAVVTMWSIFTILTGVASSFLFLIVVRFLFGVGEAGAFPGMARAVFKWIPASERGIVNGINFSGARIGGAIALPIVAGMLPYVGWRGAFALFGVLGLVWAGFWWVWFRDDPSDHAGVSPAELAVIRPGTDDTSGESREDQASRSAVSSLLRARNAW